MEILQNGRYIQPEFIKKIKYSDKGHDPKCEQFLTIN